MKLKALVVTPIHFLGSHLLMIGIIAVIYFGWMNRESNYLSAESGTGYYLGIVGGSMMLVLLLYPISKRIKTLTRWIPLRYWFGFHMLLGIIGPVLILFHSNFKLGSTNSSIALFSMLLVAFSGLIGRYIYTLIHHGLYGSRISLNELKNETNNNHNELLKMYAMDVHLNDRLQSMEEKVLRPYSNLLTSLLHVISLAINARRLKFKVIRLIKISYKENNKNKALPDSKAVIKSVDRYTLALRQTAAFRVYERLFSLWHVFHLPFFIMMILTAITHIFAVHMY